MTISALLSGHTDSVLCCEVSAANKLLASGGEDGTICLTDLSTLKLAGRVEAGQGEAVPSLRWHPGAGHERCLFAAAGSRVLHLDLRRGLDASALLASYAVGREEVNAVAVTAAGGGWLAAADDGGEVQLISLQGGKAEGQPPAYKTLRRGHSNIAAAVAFRPHRPWEVLSGGLDAAVVRWDFSRLRPLHTWSLSSEAAASGGQLFNPPMVHSLAVPRSDDRQLCRLVAVGRGDGAVSLYDGDAKPAAASGGGKKGAKPRQRAGGQQAAATAPAGRLALLGSVQGGHTLSVNSLCFVEAAGWRQLLTAGNDCRLLLWNWPVAQAAAEQAEQAAAEQGDAAGGNGGGGLRQGGPQQQAAQPGGAAPGGDGAAQQPLLAAEHRHRRKINWACPADVPGCPYNAFLADTGSRITALALA